MTISYKWLHEYLPETVDPERLSQILTSIGLEVESMEKKEDIPGGLEGLLVGEVLECTPHPNADKLKITKVNVGSNETLSIVCGASNVGVGQKVIVAPIGSTIYPVSGEPLKMKKAKIRGEESSGMICAEDEIGLGTNHDGIMVLDSKAIPGTTAKTFFEISSDWIYEIGLTPNRMDAMSHLGVARDVVAYLNYHDKKNISVASPLGKSFSTEKKTSPINVEIIHEACKRYAGVTIEGITVKESPDWLKKRLQSIGLKPINNVVDITNFILHETGQPLHAFDVSAIRGNKVIVRTANQGEHLITLDGKKRELHQEDLLICNEKEAMCIAGVFGGEESGVKNSTTSLFLESAWFDQRTIRKTSFRYQLRTDAAARFEKGVDISNTVNVLKRAAALMVEIAGGKVKGDVIDVYPQPQEKKEIGLRFHFLKRLSGKNYHPDAVKKILSSLGFELIKETLDEIRVAVPFSKPDVHHPADLVEEIMRIDGLDNVEIPSHITITPSSDDENTASELKQKAAAFLTGNGFLEILTNSITNNQWYTEEQLKNSVKLLNNLSADHNILRPSMIESGLECIAFNHHRKNTDLLFFEFGKTYTISEKGGYNEAPHLTLLASGNLPANWRIKNRQADFYYLKGICINLLTRLGISKGISTEYGNGKLTCSFRNKPLFTLYNIPAELLKKFDIRQPVTAADFYWDELLTAASDTSKRFEEIVRFPVVERDLSVVVNKKITYQQVENVIAELRIRKLLSVSLFDVFEHERFGADNKSMSLHFEFQDKEKTLTDTETDLMMHQLMNKLQETLQAEVRK